jgi:membrane protease YdiL (CAAX protease family)
MTAPREASLADARLSGSDKRVLLLWIACGLFGALFAERYYFRAFPEASVDFKISRSDARQRARQFVEGLGENIADYQSTIVFDVDEDAKTYLEREVGLQQANRLMSGQLNIWYWEVRFFRPQQEEEFKVRISPAGNVVGYEHRIEETRAAKSFERAQALSAAENFLETKMGDDLGNWRFLPEESNSTARANRVDWSFTWERNGFRANEARYRLVVGLEGDRVGSSQEFLQVPEAWTRDYKHLRSTNELYTGIATIPYVLIMGAALWVGIALTRQGKVTWTAPLKLGLVVALLFALMEFNQWDLLRAGYDTQDSYSSFVIQRFVLIVLGAFGTALTVSLVLPGGEALYRELQLERLRLYEAFTARGLRSKEFFCASVVGLSLASAHIGFIVAFYLLGGRFGVWAPQDLNYSDVVNTSFPWIAGVAIGVMAATSEEFLFRLFAIPFLRKVTRSRIVAVILPAFMWSFLHSNYPQEPGYIRGIEVGLIGIVAGLVMLRWGIVATLIWHYTVDASLVGMLLIRSDNLYFKISGVVVGLAAVAPLALSGTFYLLRGRFEPVDDLLNAGEKIEVSVARHATVVEPPFSTRLYDRLSPGTVGFLALCVIAGTLLAWRIKTEHIGDYLRLASDPRAVRARADAILREHSLDPDTFHKGTQFVDTTSPVVNEFLRRRMPISEINRIYATRVPGALWRVRYFRDSQPEEFAVVLRPDASPHSFWHTLPEAAKGASLSKEEAVAIAERYLTGQKHVDLSNWKLVVSDSDKRPNRTDHTLTWQQSTALDSDNSAIRDPAEHAYARIEMKVLGDEPADYRTYIKIPEEFARKQDEGTLPRTLFFVARLVLGLALPTAVLVFYFRTFRTSPAANVPWRRILLWGGVGFAAFALNLLFGSSFERDLSLYPTAYPLKIYYGGLAVRYLLLGAVQFGALVLIFGLGWYFSVRAFGEDRLPTWPGMPNSYYRDAFWIAIGGASLLVGLQHALEALGRAWPTLHRALPSSVGDHFDAVFPGVGVLGGAILRALFITGILALAGAFLGAELRVRWLRLLLFFAVPVAFVSDWGSPADFLKQFLALLVLMAVVVFGIRHVARFNLLGWFLVVATVGLLRAAAELLSQADLFYRVNGYIILATLAALLAWPLLAWRFGAERSSRA